MPPVAEGVAGGCAQRLRAGQRGAVEVAPAAQAGAGQRQVVGAGLEAWEPGLHGQLLVERHRQPELAAPRCAAAGVLRQCLRRLAHVASGVGAGGGVGVAKHRAVGNRHACSGQVAAAGVKRQVQQMLHVRWTASGAKGIKPGPAAAASARESCCHGPVPGMLTCWRRRRRRGEGDYTVDLVEPHLNRLVLSCWERPVVPQCRRAVPVRELEAIRRAYRLGLHAFVDGIRDWDGRRYAACA